MLCADVTAQDSSGSTPEKITASELERSRVFSEKILPLLDNYGKAYSGIDPLLSGRPGIGEGSSVGLINQYIKQTNDALRYINSNGLFGMATELDNLRASIDDTSNKESSLRERISRLQQQIEQADGYKSRAKNKKDKQNAKEIAADEAEEIDRKEALAESTQEVDDDFWSGGTDESLPKKSAAQEDADFWTGVGDEIEQQIDSKNFWSGANEDTGSDNSDDGFWEGQTDSAQARSTNYEIKRGKSFGINGVVAKNGNILIPFQKWDILSFKSGMARVRKSIDRRIEGRCKAYPNASDSNYDGYFYWVQPFEEGLVNREGKWIIPPTKKVKGDWDRKNWFGLTMRSEDSTEADARRAKAEENRRMRACKTEIKGRFENAMKRYIAQAYQRIK